MQRVRDDLPFQLRNKTFANDLTSLLSGMFHASSRRTAENVDAVEFPRISAAELASEEYQIQPLIENIAYIGQPMIIGGPSKSLKTTLAIDFGVALSANVPFLNRFQPVGTFRVGIMSGESGLATLQETTQRIAQSHAIELKDIGENLIFSDQVPRIADPSHDAGLRAWIKDRDVLIIDPAYLSIDSEGRESSIFGMGRYLRRLAEISAEANCTPILIHHTKQSGGRKGTPSLHQLSWAGFEQFARQWMILGRRSEYKPGSGQHALRLTVGGSVGHSGLFDVDVDEGVRTVETSRHWVVNASDVSKNSKEAKANARLLKDVDDIAAVVSALRKSQRGMTQAELRQVTKFNGTKFKTVITSLIESGTVQVMFEERNGRKTNLYLLGG